MVMHCLIHAIDASTFEHWYQHTAAYYSLRFSLFIHLYSLPFDIGHDNKRKKKNKWAWIHHDIIIDPFVIFYGGASFKRQVMISVIRQSYLPSVIYPALPALLFAEYQRVRLWIAWMDRCGSAMLDGTEYGSSQCFAHKICWKASECLAHLDRDLVQLLKRSGLLCQWDEIMEGYKWSLTGKPDAGSMMSAHMPMDLILSTTAFPQATN